MTTGPEDQMAAAARGHLRASQADREHVIDTLKIAFVQDRLTKDEFDLRVGQTFAARTYSQLAVLTADLPAGLAGAQPLCGPVRAQARPTTKAVPWSVWVILAADLVLLVLLAAFFRNLQGLKVAVLANLVALPLAGGQMLDSWREKCSRRQLPPLPPRPAQRGRTAKVSGTADSVMI